MKFRISKKFYQLCLLAFAVLLCLSLTVRVKAEIASCAFEDTVDLTGYNRYPDGSYLYENVVIPAHLIGSYNYDKRPNGSKIFVNTHTRGCVCKVKLCVKFCCPPTEHKSYFSAECIKRDISYSPRINVKLANGVVRTTKDLSDFVVQLGIPCTATSPLPDPKDWTLFENGTLLRTYDKRHLSKLDYCMSPYKHRGEFVLSPFHCLHEFFGSGQIRLKPNAIVFGIIAAILACLYKIY